MASGPDFRSFRINSTYGFPDNSWTDEHDCVPLKQRLKMLLDRKRLSGLCDTGSEKASKRPSIHPIDIAVNTEDQQCSTTLTPCSVLSKFPVKLEDFADHNLPILVGDDVVGALGTEVQAVKIRNEVDDDFVDDLDHVVLKERRRLLLSRKSLELTKPVTELSNPVGDETIQHMIRREKKENHYGDVGPLVVGNSTHALAKITSDFDITSRSGKSKVIVAGSSCSKQGVTIIQENDRICSSNESFGGNGFVSGNPHRKVILALPSTTVNIKAEPLDCCDVRKVEKDVTRNSPPNCIISVKSEMEILEASFGDKEDQVVLQDKIKLVASRQLPNLHSSKNFECSKKTVPSVLNCSPNASEFAKPMKINRPRKKRKNELLDHADAHTMEKDAACKSPLDCALSVKHELEIPEGSYGDKVDHMLLRDRINLLASREPPNLVSSRNFACLKKIVPSIPNCSSIVSELAKPIVINRPRKKRKTATDSVETALEEDAPGLLQVLIDKGVLVSEMRLYGEPESDGVLDDSEDNFSELEVVISKLFSDRQFLLKLPLLLRCTKDEKPSYCLACLLSLVEQARFLQFRKWPVEWGWCRDLQSFIFVFERHNRIVLERPEYGYATYFFELLDSLPIHWQIKRLVTAMKLTSCSRVTILENKALTVGDDLTEGEARVLNGYGWIPNSGLGTMLNYCDRVVHDRKNERDSSDWRSKIGKLLMDGYNGGTIVSTDIPKKFTGCSSAHGPEIKLELT